jgi:excisionase family DNA binding protein
MTFTSTEAPARTNFLTADEVASQLRVPLATLYKWRVVGGGPDGHFVGRHLRFTQQAVDSWFEGGGNKSAAIAAKIAAKAVAKVAARG